MATHWGKCCKEEKTVILQVYKERPRSLKRTGRSLNHQIIGKNQVQQQGSNVWYDRRAEILHYSRQLRESARLGQGTPPTSENPVPSANHQPPTKVVSIQRNPSYKAPTCLGNYRMLTTRFLASLMSFSTDKGKKKKKKRGSDDGSKMKTWAVAKSSEVRGRWRFLATLLGKLWKRRRTRLTKSCM